MTATVGLAAEKYFTAGDGTKLRLWEEGAPDAPITLVLVHGWTLSSEIWDRVVPAVTTASEVRVLRYDLRGHGDSEAAAAGAASVARCADDLAELIAERVPSGPVVLAGHSMGGMTIMALAERHPELFAARVVAAALVATSSGDLVAPPLGLPGPVARTVHRGELLVRAQLAEARGKRVSKYPAPLRPGMRWLLFGSRPQQRDIAATARWVADCNPANMAAFRASLAEHERTHALAALRSIPVVVLAGLADRLCPLPHARRIADALPDAELLLYAGAGHMLPLERTDEVADRVIELIDTAARS